MSEVRIIDKRVSIVLGQIAQIPDSCDTLDEGFPVASQSITFQLCHVVFWPSFRGDRRSQVMSVEYEVTVLIR